MCVWGGGTPVSSQPPSIIFYSNNTKFTYFESICFHLSLSLSLSLSSLSLSLSINIYIYIYIYIYFYIYIYVYIYIYNMFSNTNNLNIFSKKCIRLSANRTISNFQTLRYETYFLRMIPYFLYFSKYFGDNWEVYGSRF